MHVEGAGSPERKRKIAFPLPFVVWGKAHMGKGGGRWGEDAPPLRFKNKSPPLHQKNGYQSQKILDLFYYIPLFTCGEAVRF